MSLPNVAYFSMEIAIDQSLNTYSGGLGFLAGSHMLSAGYLQMPMVGVSILWSYGYYDQRISHTGDVEVAYIRKYYDFLKDTGVQVDVDIFGEKVKVKALLVEPELFGTCPVYFLTTDIDGNSDWAKSITYKLYDGNEKIRIAQEIVLGIAGVRILQKIGYKFDVIHMNEGHALPAAFELLRQHKGDLNEVKKRTVFTTHTPVAAGNEVHWVDTLLEGGFFAGASRETAINLGGENFSLTVGETQMIPGFTEQIEGHKAGDKFTIQVKFPEDYHAENLKGKDAEFDIVVNSVSELSLPEVNEDFVKVFGVKDGSLDTFKSDLRKNMERELNRAKYTITRGKLFDALVAQYGEFAVPEAYVEAEKERLAKNFEQQMRAYGMKKLPDSLKKDDMFNDEAVKSARLGAIVRKIVESLGLAKPSDEFVEAQLEQIAGAYEDPAELKEQIRKDKTQFDAVQNAALESEVVAKVMEKAADGEEEMTFDQLVNHR